MLEARVTDIPQHQRGLVEQPHRQGRRRGNRVQCPEGGLLPGALPTVDGRSILIPMEVGQRMEEGHLEVYVLTDITQCCCFCCC